LRSAGSHGGAPAQAASRRAHSNPGRHITRRRNTLHDAGCQTWGPTPLMEKGGASSTSARGEEACEEKSAREGGVREAARRAHFYAQEKKIYQLLRNEEI